VVVVTVAEKSVPAFVATTGGHLVQLHLLAPHLEPDRYRDGIWITHRTPQSESMLADRRVHFVPEMNARDWRTVVRETPAVLGLLRRHRVDTVYSTGAALALSALPGSRIVGAKPRFIESLARSDGPSKAGQILACLPWVPVNTQYPGNASRRWKFEHSLLDVFTSEEAVTERTVQRVFVTLGTTRPWQFRRLIQRVREVLPSDVDVVWQTGVTDVSGLDVDARPMMSEEHFRAEIAAADVVVSHAGCGTFMRCLEAGKVPVLVPRRARYAEHVDDHQEQIAGVADARGLALMREVDELTADDLTLAMGRRALPVAPAGEGPGRRAVAA
jgi:UDP-N-acetylglucosamine--N-acetylmuramyl-(pentapeptide) pyrophosphoryl-undecaprenol N-acetylglucosamine transferase